MSLSDDPVSPTEKIRTSKSQEPQENFQDSPFLQPKHFSGAPVSHTSQEPRETQQNSPFLQLKETEMLFSGVSNTDEEPLTSRQYLFSENPNDLESNVITTSATMNTEVSFITNLLLLASAGDPSNVNSSLGSGWNMASQQNTGESNMIPNPGFNSSIHGGIGMNADSEQGEGYGTNYFDPFGNQNNSSLDSEWKNAFIKQRCTDQIKMIDTPGFEASNTMMIPQEQQQQLRHDIGGQNSRTLHNLGSQREEEKRTGVSEKLTPCTDPWTIKKTLFSSDINKLHRLMLKATLAEDHIMKHLSADDQRGIQEGNGAEVTVYDHDTKTEHQLNMLRYRSSGSYVFNNGWVKEFVQRRNLKEGEEIGLYWDSDDSKLHFCVLSRAPADQKHQNS